MYQNLIRHSRQIIPPLDGTLHKGQSGRIGIVGGSKDYTGAPFFSGYAALKLGVDLSHIVCEPSAAQVIKTYSPDLMVHSYLSSPKLDPKLYRSNQIQFEQLLDRLHVLVIGPGLGRDQENQDWAEWAIQTSIIKNIYLVLDADALWLLKSKPKILQGYRQVILTPNRVEFQRLLDEFSNLNDNLKEQNNRRSDQDLALELSKTLGGCTILLKSATDIIAQCGSEPVEISTRGSPKRCGGQGDILSGLVGTWLAWIKIHLERSKKEQEAGGGGRRLESEKKSNLTLDQHDDENKSSEGMLLSAALGSILTRRSAYLTFQKFGRSMQSSNILDFVGEAFQLHLDDH